MKPAALIISGKAQPSFDAALQLAGFPADAFLVVCHLKTEAGLPPLHVDATCCVCGADVARSQLSFEVAVRTAKTTVAVGCLPCVKKALDDSHRMGVA